MCLTWPVVWSVWHGNSSVTKHAQWSYKRQKGEWPCILHVHSLSHYWECKLSCKSLGKLSLRVLIMFYHSPGARGIPSLITCRFLTLIFSSLITLSGKSTILQKQGSNFWAHRCQWHGGLLYITFCLDACLDVCHSFKIHISGYMIDRVTKPG